MKHTLVLAIALFFLPVLVAGQAKPAGKGASSFVGYEYKGVRPDTVLPNGVKLIGGGLIGDIDADPVYGISQVSKGSTQMFWLEASTGRDANGVTGWKVVDVLALPPAAKKHYIFFLGDPMIECTRNGKDVPNLVGIGRILRTQKLFQPSKMWTANIRSKKFEPIGVTGLKCIYSEP